MRVCALFPIMCVWLTGRYDCKVKIVTMRSDGMGWGLGLPHRGLGLSQEFALVSACRDLCMVSRHILSPKHKV